ncbi:MAG: hypothetical protein E4G96_06180 [Chrysiogenales bacterium]|nr:MAG: hypothetical protein E4G96_06180 [Chrysiogenales bacterium]
MAEKKPYLHGKLIGVRPFTDLLDHAGVGYVLFDDGAASRLYEERPDHFHPGDDAIRVGKCVQDDAGVYFAEFGIRITPSFRSHIVFIFDHHPLADEILIAADDLDGLVAEGLEGVDPGDIMKFQ